MPRLAIPWALGLILAACGGEGGTATGQQAEAGERVSVVVTTTILGDVVRNVVGDAADVEVLMPIGVDPHSFEPSAQQMRAMRDADLIVASGLLLEEQLTGPIESAEAEGVQVLSVGEEVDPLPFAEGGHDDDDDAHDDDDGDDGHGYGEKDPHFWLDPVRMAEGARLLGAELAGLDADAIDDWTARAEDYAGELEQLSSDIEEQLAGIPEGSRKLVTNHEAFGYFAERYDFEVVGAVIPGGTTLEEPSAADLRDLAGIIDREQVPAIFTETTQPARLAESLATEADLDVQVVELYTESLSEDGGTDGDTYIGMMRINAQRISGALSWTG
ncbi:MAG: zinc ABC transporter substrate-binding protein [Nitriliruptorales bacterium]|nr:zinc ABC transporter substrate-binding protein [Nitriliruptorales bacterium]